MSSHTLTVLTFNLQHCHYFPEKRIAYDPFATEIHSFSPDLVGLNEVRGEGKGEGFDPQTELLAEKTGMQGFFARAIDVGDRGPYGNAFLSRAPLFSAEVIPIPDPVPRRYAGYYETRCVLRAVLEIEALPFTVLVSHFGLNPDERENAVQTILPLLTPERCILMGDFNTTPDDAILSPLRQRMKEVTEETGNPDASFLTFPSDAPNRKIDYLFASPDLRVLNAGVSEHIVSDHRALYARLSF